MATTPRSRKVEYPTSDGRPMAETELHRELMIDLIRTLQRHLAADPAAFVSGNLLLFYEEGNRRKHVSPDVFVVFGVPKGPLRDYYLVWEEGRGPDVVIELTSKTTKAEDQRKKRDLYRDVLAVPEYYLFDPTEDYLRPSLQGFRLGAGGYEPIEPVDGRLPSARLGLLLGREGDRLRLYDAETGRRLPTPAEIEAELAARAAEAQARAAEAQARAEGVEDDNDRLRREVEELRRRLGERG